MGRTIIEIHLLQKFNMGFRGRLYQSRVTLSNRIVTFSTFLKLIIHWVQLSLRLNFSIYELKFRFSNFAVHISAVLSVAQPARQFSPAMQIQNYYHYSFLCKLIIFTVNEHENIIYIYIYIYIYPVDSAIRSIPYNPPQISCRILNAD